MAMPTVSTVKSAESVLGDSEAAGLTVSHFESGISGDCSFAFTKVKKEGSALPGAMFSLYISLDFTVGADRIVYSGDDGVVSFRNLPEGIFYVQETVAPYDYILDGTIYKVVLSKTGFEIYYGDNFENKLSDHDNKIVNRSKYDVEPISVPLEGTKKLTGRTLSSGMFNFIVKGVGGTVATTGTNNANGSINFGEIKFDTPGVYTFTIEEVSGGYSGITYDVSKFKVTVTVTNDGSGKLTAEVYYPDGGVVFNNSYAEAPVKPCLCYARATKCRKSIEGKKIWLDNDNAKNTRPHSVKINLLRDGEVYKSIEVDSADDRDFVFCCLPKYKSSSNEYFYQIDEDPVPGGYTKTIEGYNVINKLIP